ncbi:MAG TPA: sce7726 family protein [Segatella copri]|nr:sce7726 family protein [Segatella copri]
MMKQDVQTYNIMDRMRSYSSAFSRALFTDIIKYGDCSRLDAIHDRYDGKRKKEKTYFSYLKYLYRQISINYRCEYVYKNELIELLIKKYAHSNAVIFNEFRMQKSIVDLAMFNGNSRAFEIKTEYDTTRRLIGQLVDYTRVFQLCYVVIPANMLETYEKDIPPYIGIVLMRESGGVLELDEARPAVENKNIDAGMMMKCLRTKEYENMVIEEFGKLPDVPYYEMYEACEEKLYDMPPDKLHQYFLKEIEKRKNNMCLLKKAPRELRQMYLQLGLSKGQIDILQTYLNNPIKSQLKLCISHI